MLTIDIPGAIPLKLTHLVLDYNGTLALDGELLAGVDKRLKKLSSVLKIHVLTADTHGTVREKLRTDNVTLHIIGLEQQDIAKKTLVVELGASEVVAMGNGRNDMLMLEAAALGVGIVQAEGAAAGILHTADIICTSILDALDLLLCSDRLRATLRN